MTALEEWLQEKYVEYYNDANNASNKPELLASKMEDLFLKEDSSRNYVINGGRTYYLLNKYCTSIPNEIRSGLKGGDTTDLNEFIRLIDVYGVTEDLKVFYIDTSSGETYGTVENYEIDPTLKSMKSLSNSGVASQLSNALNALGFNSTADNITLGQISTLSNFTLDGEGINNLTDLSSLSDAISLETLTLENLNLSSMKGLEKLTKLYYLYLRNVTCDDYSVLCNLWELTHLYIYMPSSSMDQATCDAQVINLGEGLSNASKLTKLKNFGISGTEMLFKANSLTYKNSSNVYVNSNLSQYSISCFANDEKSHLSSLGTTTTGLGKFNLVLKNGLTNVLLNNNSFSEISALKDFTGIYQLLLMSNKNLYDISGITNHSSINILTLQDCALGSLDTSEVVSDYRATGLTGLQYLSIAKNTRLTSLQGLEKSSNLKTLLGFRCNLTDISALGTYTYKTDEETGEITTIIDKITNPHQSLDFLNLRNNSNLVFVDSIGGLTGLSSLYMSGCSSLDYDSTYKNINRGIGKLTNTYVNTEGDNQILFLQLSNSYNGLDQKYKPLFENLLATQSKKINFSTDTLKNLDGTAKILEDSDPLISAIKLRTDIELLNLNGQISLDASTVNTIIDSNKGSLKYLGLKGLTQIEHFGDYEGEDAEWVTYRAALRTARESNPPLADPPEPSAEGKILIKTLPALDNCTKLAEIDIRGTSTHVSMRQITQKIPKLLIIMDNTNINVNELSEHLESNENLIDALYGRLHGDLALAGVGDNYFFDNYNGSKFCLNQMNVPDEFSWTGCLDLSKTNIEEAHIYAYSDKNLSCSVKYPDSLKTFLSARAGRGDDFSLCSNLTFFKDEVFNGSGYSSINSNARLTDFQIRLGYNRTYDFSKMNCFSDQTSFFGNLGGHGKTCVIAGDCGSFKLERCGAEAYRPTLSGLENLVSTQEISLSHVDCGENAEFVSNLSELYLNDIDFSNLKFVKQTENSPQKTINITLKDCLNLTSFSVLPDNLSIGTLDISGCPISGDYMPTLCSRFYRNGSLIINNLAIKSDSLASTSTVGTQWVKTLLELHEAGLSSIKIGGKYIDNQAIEWLKNGVEIDGVEYEGFGASNVTIYN